MPEVFITRQAIFDRQTNVFAYDLLFPAAAPIQARGSNDDSAAVQVLVNSLVDVGLRQLVADHLAFVALPRNLVLQKYHHALPKDRVVLGVSADGEGEELTQKLLSGLSQHGYRTVLERYWGQPSWAAAVELADFVKLDLARMDAERLGEHVAALQGIQKQVIAVNVDRPEQFELCKAAGFHYFQGSFFRQPPMLSANKQIPADRASLLQLYMKLGNPNVSVDDVAAMIEVNVALSCKLLRYLNSAATGLPRKVDSVRDAVVILGIDRIRSLVVILALAGASEKPPELTATAIQRAIMCELLARAMNQQKLQRFYTVGLLSVIDSLLDTPMARALPQLGLAPEIHEAILNHSGQLGSILKCVLAYECGNWQSVADSGLDGAVLLDSYTQSIVAAAKIQRSLGCSA